MTAFETISTAYIASGFGVGFIVGLTGVGGGSLMTPLLVLLFGVHPAAAVGTDLLYAAVTKFCGAAVHHIGRSVEWSVVGLLAAGSLPATVVTLLVLYQLGATGDLAAGLISHVLGYALLLTALSLIFRRYLSEAASALALNRSPRIQRGITILLGAVLGLLVTLSSVGAGAIGVSILLILRPRLPVARIIGSDIAHAVPLTLLAGLGHLSIGTVDLTLLASLLIGSLPGIAIGSVLAPRVPERGLRLVLAAVLSVVGGRLAVY